MTGHPNARRTVAHPPAAVNRLFLRAPAGALREDGRDVTTLARRLGLFDATMIVMGGIIGAGIFMNPSVVARLVHTPFLMLAAWVAGGVVALAGAFVYAELGARRPAV